MRFIDNTTQLKNNGNVKQLQCSRKRYEILAAEPDSWWRHQMETSSALLAIYNIIYNQSFIMRLSNY